MVLISCSESCGTQAQLTGGQAAVDRAVPALKETLSFFFLSNAKSQLLKDISALDTTVKFPHVPQRRDNNNRLSREVDDILSLFICLDENKLLDALPRYVADGPDSMPPLDFMKAS